VILSFFFSSRRPHTISKRDWSSDVCSSDLEHTTQPTFPEFIPYLHEINTIYFLYIINIFILKHTPFFTEKKYQSPNLHPLYIFRSEERRVGKECISLLCPGQ